MGATQALSEATAYGGFTLGSMQLALPMSALREVVPCLQLARLPCPAACVVGGIDLRGVMVPVVDLRILLGEAPCGDAPLNVVIMVHRSRLIGLLAHGVTSIFNAEAGSLKRQHTTDPTAAIHAASIRREGDGMLMSVLAPEALADLPQVPMVEDPEPARQQLAGPGSSSGASESDARSVMLFRCGRVFMAIEAMTVQAALATPTIEHSPLSLGNCRGVIAHAGYKVPMVDLQALCGFGAIDDTHGLQSFIVSLEGGMVGLLVSEVIDVVRVHPRDMISLSSLALTEADFFMATVPTSALPQELVERTGLATSQYLLIDSEALCASQALQTLSLTNTAIGKAPDSPGSSSPSADPQGRPAGRAMLTFELTHETATPIDQLAEILPYRSADNVFEGGWPMAGLIVDRGRSIPVLSLGGLMGATTNAERDIAVLVVQVDAQWMGFSVPRLCSIETTRWEPTLPARVRVGGDDVDLALHSGQLALFGAGPSERTLRVLDLQRLAGSLLKRQPARRAAIKLGAGHA
jgi:purine-binding chemotaxis protein CheW